MRFAGVLIHDDAFFARFGPAGRTPGIHRCTSWVDNCLPSERQHAFHHLTEPLVCSILFHLPPTGSTPGETDVLFLAQMRPLRCSCPRIKRTVHGVGELHAGLAQCVASGEVVGCVDLNGNHTLARLTRAAVPTFFPKAHRMPWETRSAPAPVACLFSRSTWWGRCGHGRA